MTVSGPSFAKMAASGYCLLVTCMIWKFAIVFQQDAAARVLCLATPEPRKPLVDFAVLHQSTYSLGKGQRRCSRVLRVRAPAEEPLPGAQVCQPSLPYPRQSDLRHASGHSGAWVLCEVCRDLNLQICKSADCQTCQASLRFSGDAGSLGPSGLPRYPVVVGLSGHVALSEISLAGY
jgi:hypothetical protein